MLINILIVTTLLNICFSFMLVYAIKEVANNFNTLSEILTNVLKSLSKLGLFDK